jgi:hypothetical protein
MKKMLPIGLRLKIQQQNEMKKKVKKEVENEKERDDYVLPKSKLTDLEQEIISLEREVEQTAEYENSMGSDESENEINAETAVDDLLVEVDDEGNVTKYFSTLQEKEKIIPLKKTMLPQPKCLFVNDNHSSKRKVQFDNDSEATMSLSNKKIKADHYFPSTLSSIQKAIDSYIPSSQKKLPFYCRVCQIQLVDLNTFETHQTTPEHLEKKRLDRSICYCHLCNKQFTSPEQLKEHKRGKAHLERLEKRRRGNENQKKFSRY